MPFRTVGLQGNGSRPGEIGPRVGVQVVDDKLAVEPGPDARTDDQKAHVLVCGSEPMLRALCGPRARDGPTPPGQRRPPLSGLLKELGYRDDEVTWL